MAAQTIEKLTDEQKRLLNNYDPALVEAGLATKLDEILTVLNQHAAEIDLKVNA